MLLCNSTRVLTDLQPLTVLCWLRKSLKDAKLRAGGGVPPAAVWSNAALWLRST